MKNFRSFLLTTALVCVASIASAQASKKSGLFTVDIESTTATLEVPGAPLVKKYAAVFQKHKLDSASPIDWQSVIEQILGMKDTDLYISGELLFASSDEAVEISSTEMEPLDKGLKLLNEVLATPQKLDAFLTEEERLLEKSKK